MTSIETKKQKDKMMTAIFTGGAAFAVILLIAFVLYVVVSGVSGMTPQLLSFSPTGLGNMFFNTIYLVVLALVASTITGIPAGIFLAEYAKKGRITHWVRMAVETLASLPSIVVGLFGYLVFIVMTGSQWNLMAGALAVSILTLPLVTSVTEDALRNLPPSYRNGSLGLGASHWQTIWHVLLPACFPRIMTGLILAAGRGFGEAAALMFTAGMSTDIDWTNWDITATSCPLNPFRPGETLALHIWALRTEALHADAAQQAAASSAILMIMVLVFSLAARYFSYRIDKTMGAVQEGAQAATGTAEYTFDVRHMDLFYNEFQALKDINMKIKKNEITALIGPSGCGKSTFLKTLNRMNDWVEGCRVTGDIRFEGKDIFKEVDPLALRYRVGMVFQQPTPFPKSIYENIAYGPRIQGIKDKKQLDAIVEKSLRQAACWDEMKDRLSKSALGLSGGQQQRLCIARTLAADPSVILMDEPTSALDPISTQKIEDLALELKEKYTIVIVTHSMQQARRISDKTAFFLLGELIEYDNTLDMFTNPSNPKTEEYITGRFG